MMELGKLGTQPSQGNIELKYLTLELQTLQEAKRLEQESKPLDQPIQIEGGGVAHLEAQLEDSIWT